MIRRAIIYTRVSTDEQAEHGYSLQTQLESCREWANQNNYFIDHEIKDDYTGTVIERPGFSKALEIIQSGKANALIVYSADRLSRNLVHRIIIRDELQKANAELIYCSRGIIGNSSTDQFLDNVEGAVAEYEVALIKERMMRGKRAKAEKGIPVGHGVTPFGYKISGIREQTRFEIVQPEAETINLIFSMYADGKLQTEVAEYLTKLCVPSKGDNNNGHGKKRGFGKWSRMMVYRILTNESYTGIWYAFKYKTEGKKVTKRPREEWIPISIPRIISQDLWETVQKRIITRPRRKSRYQFLLSGHIKCSCGYRASGKPKHSGRKTYLYYVCSAKGRYNLQHWCGLPCFNSIITDKLVWEWIEKLILDPANMLQGFQEIRDEMKSENSDLIEKKSTFEKQLEKISLQEDRLLSLYIDTQMPKSILDNKLAELEDAKIPIEAEIQEFESQITNIPSEEDISSISDLIQQVGERLSMVTFEDKRSIVDLLDVTAILDYEDGERTVMMECLIGENIVSLTSPISRDR